MLVILERHMTAHTFVVVCQFYKVLLNASPLYTHPLPTLYLAVLACIWHLLAPGLWIWVYRMQVDVQMDKLMATRAALNKGGEKSGVKLSVTDFIIKASAMALMAVPDVNASWMGDTVRK